MKGTIHIEVDGPAMNCNTSLVDVGFADKLILLNSITKILDLDSLDLKLFYSMMETGILDEGMEMCRIDKSMFKHLEEDEDEG